MVRKLLTAGAAILIGATPVAADLASEVVSGDGDRVPSQLVPAPRLSGPFGPPNVSEFPADLPAELGEVRIVPYPRPVYPFGVPNVGEFEPAR